MSTSESRSAIVLELAEEFLERYRKGERPALKDYIDRNPELAGESHLGTQLRDAGREVTLHRGGLPTADSVSLAAQLLGKLTAPSQAAIKAETRLLVQEALNSMDPIDREVLALKHLEQLTTTEIAEVLGLSKAGAGSRYLRNQAPARDPRANPRLQRPLNRRRMNKKSTASLDQRPDTHQYQLDNGKRELTDQRDFPRSPVQILDLVRKDHAADRRARRDCHLIGVSLDLAGDRTKKRETGFFVIYRR